MNMAHLKFRITSITLDEEEDVTNITAVARDDAHETIRSILGDVETTAGERGGTEMTVVLPLEQMRHLFTECGRMNSLDPRSDKGGNEIYDSLTHVFYGLMGE